MGCFKKVLFPFESRLRETLNRLGEDAASEYVLIHVYNYKSIVSYVFIFKTK